MQDSRARVSGWLQAAGRHSGFQLSLDDDGYCGLQLDEGVQCIVEVIEGRDEVLLYMPLARLPDRPEDAQRATQLALIMNSFGLDSGAGTFGYDPRTNHVLLTLAVRVELLDESLFCSILGEFIDSGMDTRRKFMIGLGQQEPVQAFDRLQARPLLWTRA
jgi:hypothetical protein